MNKFIMNFLLVLVTVGFCACGDPNGPSNGDPDKKDTTSVVQVTPANDIVVYQANEKIFAKTKSLQAVDARLDEIEALGVNVLWLMPIHPIGQKNTANSPYCVKDFKGINPNFGTLDDLKTLVNHAHAKGMKVILDWIANHSALDHPWMTEHPEWYGTPTGDETAWKDVQPFNFNNSAMRLAMIDAMTYWMRTADIDGFRCDFAQGCPDDFWKQAIDSIRSVKADAIMLAETSRTELYRAGFDWLYSWAYLGAVQKIYTTGPANLYSVSDGEMASTPEGKMRLRYITNHDACSEKANSELYKSPAGMLAASCFTYFLEGVPLIYSSQEIGYMKQINFCTTSDRSVLMNWSDNPATLAAYKQMMNIYHATDTLRGGEQKRYTMSSAKVAAFSYGSSAGSLLVVVNLSGEQQIVSMPQQFINKNMTDLLTNEEIRVTRNDTLAPYEYQILTINN